MSEFQIPLKVLSMMNEEFKLGRLKEVLLQYGHHWPSSFLWTEALQELGYFRSHNGYWRNTVKDRKQWRDPVAAPNTWKRDT